MDGKRDKTAVDLSLIFNVSKAAVSYWVKQGLPGDKTLKPGGKRAKYLFDRREVDDWLRDNNRGPHSKAALAGYRKRTVTLPEKKRRKPRRKPVRIDSSSKVKKQGSGDAQDLSSLESLFDEEDIPADPKERKLFWDACKSEIAVRTSLGEMLPVEEVQRGRVRRVEVVKAGLLSLPGRLSDRLVGMDSIEIHQALNQAVRRVLKQFAED